MPPGNRTGPHQQRCRGAGGSPHPCQQRLVVHQITGVCSKGRFPGTASPAHLWPQGCPSLRGATTPGDTSASSWRWLPSSQPFPVSGRARNRKRQPRTERKSSLSFRGCGTVSGLGAPVREAAQLQRKHGYEEQGASAGGKARRAAALEKQNHGWEGVTLPPINTSDTNTSEEEHRGGGRAA